MSIFPLNYSSIVRGDLCMEVLSSDTFMAAICPGYSRRRMPHLIRQYIYRFCLCHYQYRFIRHCPEVTYMSNRYTEESFLLVVPTKRASEHIRQAYNFFGIILLLSGVGSPIFGIILVNGPWITEDFSPMNFTFCLKFNLSSIITSNYFTVLFDSISVPLTITSIFFIILFPLIKTAFILCAGSVNPASLSHAPTFRMARFVLSSISFNVFVGHPPPLCISFLHYPLSKLPCYPESNC